MLLLTGSRASISRWLKRYIAALIHIQRLDGIHGARPATAAALPRIGPQVLAQTGFHPQETWSGRAFRWSETEAAVLIKGAPGRNTVRIRCVAVREPPDRIGVRFYADGARTLESAVDGDDFVLSLDLPSSGLASVAWISPRFVAVKDPRRLGLPVAAIEVGATEPLDAGKDAGKVLAAG
jgi:hypothetical protein